MRASLAAAAFFLAAALPATMGVRAAHADGALFATRALASMMPSSDDAARHLFTLDTDPTIVARRSYWALAALPIPESKVRTYDVKPVIDAFTNKKVQLATSLGLTFITGKSLMVADVGQRTQIALSPTSFRGGAVTFAFAF